MLHLIQLQMVQIEVTITAGKATIGSSVVDDGVNNTFTTGEH